MAKRHNGLKPGLGNRDGHNSLLEKQGSATYPAPLKFLITSFDNYSRSTGHAKVARLVRTIECAMAEPQSVPVDELIRELAEVYWLVHRDGNDIVLSEQNQEKAGQTEYKWWKGCGYCHPIAAYEH